MADRGRDLTFKVLSDVDQFDTERPARGLEDLADAAEAAGRKVDGLGDATHAAGTKLGNVEDDTKRARAEVDRVGDQAHTTAKKVDTAFDAIAKSSKQNLHHKLDDDTHHAKESLREVGAEAESTGKEMAASFTGSSDDIMGALQELGANAGAAFGPLGVGLSVALGAGLGIFFADWQKKKEQLTEDVQTFTAALVEGRGQLSAEFLNSRISEIDPKKLRELGDAARDANVPVSQVIRAYAGDPEALDAVQTALKKGAKGLQEMGQAGAEADPTMVAYGNAVKKVTGELGLTSDALDQSKSAYQLMSEAMSQPVVPQVDGGPAVTQAAETRARIQNHLGRDVHVPVKITLPTAGEIDAANRAIRRGIGTIVVPVRPGTNRFTNNANNDRYRP